MTRITYLHPDGTRSDIEATNGSTVMQSAVSRGVDGIVAECGGSAMCATCHVYVEPAQLHLLAAPDAVENEMLDSTAEARQANSRLSCQLVVRPELDGLVVRLPQRQN